MNAAGRLVHQGVFTRHLVLSHLLTWRQIAVLLLSIAIIFSALSIIYVTHVTRVLYADYQHELTEQDRLHVERGQLLLERSTWIMQSRIQQIAEKKLGMIIPDYHHVVVINE